MMTINAIESDQILYLTLGDGDFTYSLDLVRYFAWREKPCKKPVKLVLSGFDTYETLASKYKDAPSILEEIKQQKKSLFLSVSVRHGVNAIIDEKSCSATGDERLEYGISAADHVLFNHPHLGTENCSLHRTFLAHLFHSATNYWMKKQDGLFHLTLMEGQFKRWKCEEQAKRHGLELLHQTPFLPPIVPLTKNDEGLQHQNLGKNNMPQKVSKDKIGLTGNRYHFRRHQTGKMFAKMIALGSTSSTYTFGRISFKGVYAATTLPWQQPDLSSFITPLGKTKIPTTKVKMQVPLFSCPLCGKEFLEERSLKCHLKDLHSNETEIDDIKEPQRKKRKKSMSTTSPAEGNTSLFCPHCPYNTSSGESSHRRVFRNTKALEAHIGAKHSALYKYIPPDWSTIKMKKTNSKINHDEPNTNNEKKVECHICGLILVDGSLSRHLQDFLPAKESQFSCKFCSKTFREERAALQHMNFCSKRPVSSSTTKISRVA